MRYVVYGRITCSCYTYVDAESEAAARRLAEGRSAHLVPYGPGRAGVDESEDFCVEDADGIVEITSISEDR